MPAMPSLHSPKSHSTNTRVYLVCSILALASHSAQGYRRSWNPRSSEIHSAKTHRIVLHKADVISFRSMQTLSTAQRSLMAMVFKRAIFRKGSSSLGLRILWRWASGTWHNQTVVRTPWAMGLRHPNAIGYFSHFQTVCRNANNTNERLQQEKLHTASERLVLDERDAVQILELSQTKDLVGENFDKNEVENGCWSQHSDIPWSRQTTIAIIRYHTISCNIIRYHTISYAIRMRPKTCVDLYPPTPAFAKAGAAPGTTAGVELLLLSFPRSDPSRSQQAPHCHINGFLWASKPAVCQPFNWPRFFCAVPAYRSPGVTRFKPIRQPTGTEGHINGFLWASKPAVCQPLNPSCRCPKATSLKHSLGMLHPADNRHPKATHQWLLMGVQA